MDSDNRLIDGYAADLKHILADRLDVAGVFPTERHGSPMVVVEYVSSEKLDELRQLSKPFGAVHFMGPIYRWRVFGDGKKRVLDLMEIPWSDREKIQDAVYSECELAEDDIWKRLDDDAKLMIVSGIILVARSSMPSSYNCGDKFIRKIFPDMFP